MYGRKQKSKQAGQGSYENKWVLGLIVTAGTCVMAPWAEEGLGMAKGGGKPFRAEKALSTL